MIELDGIEYAVQDAGTNAGEIITYINKYCNDHQIKNSKDELIQFEVNWANPLYMILYGVGYLFNFIQQLVYSAGCAISIANSSERQLLNIADMANIKRRRATKTTVIGTVWADVSGDDAHDCVITTDLTCTVNTSQGTVTFYPAFDFTVPIGESRKIVLVTDTEGSFSLTANTITSFDVPPEGFRKMETLASQPGQEQESIASLRERIQRRSTAGTVVDRCQDAISELTGVSSCNMYYNASPVDTEYVDNIPVPPRQALLFVQGYSSKIAETYWSYMSSECAGVESPNAIIQTYTTHGGQQLPVYIIPPDQVAVHIRIFTDNELTGSEVLAIQDTVSSLANSLTIGQSVSSGDILKRLQAEYMSYTFTGCSLSLNGEDWTYKVSPQPNQLIIFVNDNILVA